MTSFEILGEIFAHAMTVKAGDAIRDGEEIRTVIAVRYLSGFDTVNDAAEATHVEFRFAYHPGYIPMVIPITAIVSVN